MEIHFSGEGNRKNEWLKHLKYVVTKDKGSFFLHYCVVFHCVTVPRFFIPLATDGHLGCFLTLAIVTNAAMKIRMHIFFYIDFLRVLGGYYTKWNKPASERQISYDLTYMLNLIKKMNKQAKYNQRHWNGEPADSD